CSAGSETDCNDADGTVNPAATEVCDGSDNNCNGSIDEGFDTDGDGYNTCGADGTPGTTDDDCDDTDSSVHPGAVDICDGKDTNCDGWKPPTDVDNDGDGVPVCASDCNDNDPNRYPGAAEVCDGIDNDCNFVVPANEYDIDGDGYRPCDAQSDCNDYDANINPGLNETGAALCSDGKDNDCDTLIDNNDPPCQTCTDNDGDGYGDPGSTFCSAGSETDCNDADAVLQEAKQTVMTLMERSIRQQLKYVMDQTIIVTAV
ncbi:MAG: putative metal-binding motif-containing protein, partial [Planctomycetota bacterium]